MNELIELRKLAEAATVGVWKASGFDINSKEHGWATIANTELDYDGMAENAAYIAAANPAAVISMLDQIQALQAENESLRNKGFQLMQAYGELQAENEQLKGGKHG